jgi:hypothetical protein
LYAYCNNNPTNLIDPWGLLAGMGAVGGAIAGATAAATKCPKGNQEPTNPDSPWWGPTNMWWQYFNGSASDLGPDWDVLRREFANNRLPGAGWFSPFSLFPRGLFGTAVSELGARGLEKIATREATRNFSSFGMGRNAAYVSGLKPGYFKAATAIRFAGRVLAGATAFYAGADIGTFVYAWGQAYK